MDNVSLTRKPSSTRILSSTNPRPSAHISFARVLQSVSTTPEEEEELKRVEKWVEMMAEMDTEEVDHLSLLAWKPKRLGGAKK